MTKIYAYGVRTDEQPYIEKWVSKHPEIEVAYTDQALTAQTAHLAAGAQCVNTLQAVPYNHEAFVALADLGIKGITLRNAGTDNVDFEAAKEFGLRVSNVPSYSPNSIAEHAIIQMARLFRNLKPMDEKVARQDFRVAPTIGREMRKQTIGILGTGHIGKVALRIAQGFGANVIAYNRSQDPELAAEGLYVESFDELLAKSDGISIHVPGGPSTYHMFDEAAFAKMKDNAVLVNCSRGSIVDTKALLSALDSGKIYGAGLDVYEGEVGYFGDNWQDKELEDKVLADLLTRSNVIVSPHTAFYTTTSVEEMVEQSFDTAVAFSTDGTSPLEIKF